MADYFAVLNRTLSGFSDPKPALREKLYDRARTTIRKQLDMRRPTLDDAAIDVEMAQLEEAISRLEAGFVADAPAADPAPTPTLEEPAEPLPIEPSVTEPEAVAVAASVVDEPVAPDAEAPLMSVPASEDVPVFDSAEPAPITDDGPVDVPVFDPSEVDVPVGETFEPQPLEPSIQPEAPAFDSAIVSPEAPEIANFDAAVDQATSLGEVAASDATVSQPEVDNSEPLPAATAADPLDAWADEFLSGKEAEQPEAVVAPAAPVAAEAVSPPAAPPPLAPPPLAAPASPPAALPPIDAGEPLTIPPAPDVERGGRPKREKKASSGLGLGFVSWLLIALLLILLLLIGAAFAVPQAAPYRDAALERLGLTETLGPLFGLDDPATPTPVKTITITPQDEPEPEPTPEPQPAAPKDEDRLPQDGADAEPVAPVIEPSISGNGAADTSTAPALPAGGSSAILYEEGSAANQNSFSPGRITWSLGSEAPADGAAEEPVINARVDVPEKQLVLLMSIKRNTDAALPASHVIELVFATPDTFAGGAIADINRFVLKQSEQGRGDNLVGVPARIDDGIFLIALNNLDSARTQNVSLLRSRDWIDIPLEYRTGRRALMTMEKGETGRQVFADAFAAWDALGG
ncbi:MAG: hypothetical protein AAFO70_02535 [Pseudomonadota bacterium]